MHIGVIFAITAGLNLVLAGSCPHEENGLQKWSEKWKDGVTIIYLSFLIFFPRFSHYENMPMQYTEIFKVV